MDRYCKICRNTICINHGKDIVLAGEGWQCDYIPVPTNADRIRAMTDEELVDMLYCADSLGWCKNLPECYRLLDTDDGVPDEKCKACLLKWLQQPAEGD